MKQHAPDSPVSFDFFFFFFFEYSYSNRVEAPTPENLTVVTSGLGENIYFSSSFFSSTK